MKFVFAFLLVVASVHANSLHRYGWTPGKESVYRFESQILGGIPEIKHDQMGGLKLTCNVRVQSFSDYSLRVKMENVQMVLLNGDVKLSENGRVIGTSGSEGGHIPEEFLKQLQEPFLVHLKSGVVQTFQVSQQEPSAVTNIKRSVLAQLQLDVTGSQRSKLEYNHIQLPTPQDSDSPDPGMTYFFTQEESLQGKCRTSYTINKIPEYKVKELEEQWAKEEKELKGENSDSFEYRESEAQRYCEGKPYYQIVKTKDLDHCKRSPVFQKWTGIAGRCNLSKPSTCAGMILSVSSSTYYVCGELSQYQIRHIKTVNTIKNNPIGFTTDEKLQSATQVNVELVKVNPITERLPLPSSLKEEKSIVYAFPKQSELQGQIPEETIRQSMEILGTQPILPQPGLNEAPHTLLPFPLTSEQIKSQALEQLKKMASEASQSPESCSSKSDISGTMMAVVQYLRHLSLSELQQLETQVRQSGQQQGHVLEKLFWDVLSGVGTNPSTMLIIKKVKEGSLPTGQTVKVIQHTLRNVRYPTKELLQELVGMAKNQNVKSKPQLLAAILGNLSNLFYRAYVNPSTMMNNFPSQIYGAFGSRDSQVLTQQWIPYLTSIAEGQESGIGQGSARKRLQYTAIVSLGRTGHLKAIKPILKAAEGKLESETGQGPEEARIMRPLAVHSLKNIAKVNPTKVKPLLMAIIENTVEAPEVRTAAVAILPFTQPNPNDIQAIALRSWFEPSRQVANFIRTTLYSIVDTEIPEFKPMIGYVKSAIPLMKKEDSGYLFARNMHFNQFVQYLQTGVVSGYQLERSKKSFVPTMLGGKTKFYGPQGAYKVGGPSWEVYLQGMDQLVEKYVKYLSYAGKATENTKQKLQQIYEQLGIQTRGFQPPQLFGTSSILGIHYDTFLDSETVMQILDEITREFEQGEKAFSFDTVSGSIWHESTGFGTTDAGLPVINSVALPIVYSAKGHFKAIGQGSMNLPEIEASIVPVVNVKAQSSMGVITPFTKEVVGTGVEASVHSSIPVAVNAKVTEGELLITIKNPTETERNGRESESLHGFVLPYTYKKSMLSVKPTSKSQSLKEIVSGNPRTIEMPIGQSLGLAGKLIAESNNVFSDLSSYLEKIRQTSVNSLMPVAIIPSSVRKSSTKVKYNPGQSETKEFQLRLKLRSHVSSQQQVPWFRPIRDEDVEPDFKFVKSVYEQVKTGQHSEATLFSLTASTKGQYSSKSMRSTVILGKTGQQNGQDAQTYAALNYKIGNSGSRVYGIQYEGKATLPKAMNRWNLEQLVQEQLSGEFSGKIKIIGQSGQEQEVQVSGKVVKSEEQKQAVKRSPEYKKCQQEMQEDRKLTHICREARLQASSLDNIEIRIERYPDYLANHYLVTLLKQLVESYFLGQTSHHQGSGSGTGLVIKAKVDRTGYFATAEISTPSGDVMKIKNIRILGYTKNILPLPVQISPVSSLSLALSKNRVPFTCTVEPKTVTTFDNRTYGYQMNDCEHLLLQDGAKNFPVAVLARSVQSGSQKEVRILSGESEVKVSPQGGSTVEVNGKQVKLNTGEVKKILSNERTFVQVELKKYQDNTLWVQFPQQGLSVVTDGKRIEVVVGAGYFWNRAVGLCGDMNGEAVADLRSPKKCMMTPQVAAVSYLLNKSGSSSVSPHCEGIPSQYKKKWEEESQQCLKEYVVPTPLHKIFSQIKDISVAHVKHHIVDKQTGQVCISKEMLNTCQGKPLKVRHRTVEFACVERPSLRAETLEKRAFAGEPLVQEIKPMPTVFRKVEVEPVQCSEW